MKVKRYKQIAALLGAAIILTGCGSNSKGLEFSFKKNDYVRYEVRVKSPVNIAVLRIEYDSEGGVHVYGNEDRYYTDDEKAAQEEARQQRIKLQEEVFSQLEGTWESESGDSFTIYQQDEEYCIDVVEEGVQNTFSPVWFGPGPNYTVSYNAGACEGGFRFEMSEDGSGFDYYGEIFKKK